MAPKEKHCSIPKECTGIVQLKNELIFTRKDYSDTQDTVKETKKSLDKTTSELIKTNIHLASHSKDIQHVCDTIKNSDGRNISEHDTFFARLRSEETERMGAVSAVRQEVTDKLSDLKVGQATKLSTMDLIKIIGGIGVLVTIIQLVTG